MSTQDYEEYERDEQMLEARRLKRLEMKRKRKIQQRIILAILAVVLIRVFHVGPIAVCFDRKGL